MKLSGIAINPPDGCCANVVKAASISASLLIGMATVSTANIGAAEFTKRKNNPANGAVCGL